MNCTTCNSPKCQPSNLCSRCEYLALVKAGSEALAREVNVYKRKSAPWVIEASGSTEPIPWQIFDASKPTTHTLPKPHDDNINRKPIPVRSNRKSYRRR